MPPIASVAIPTAVMPMIMAIVEVAVAALPVLANFAAMVLPLITIGQAVFEIAAAFLHVAAVGQLIRTIANVGAIAKSRQSARAGTRGKLTSAGSIRNAASWTNTRSISDAGRSSSGPIGDARVVADARIIADAWPISGRELRDAWIRSNRRSIAGSQVRSRWSRRWTCEIDITGTVAGRNSA